MGHVCPSFHSQSLGEVLLVLGLVVVVVERQWFVADGWETPLLGAFDGADLVSSSSLGAVESGVHPI